MGYKLARNDKQPQSTCNFARAWEVKPECRREADAGLPDSQNQNQKEPAGPVEAWQVKISAASDHILGVGTQKQAGSTDNSAPLSPTATANCLLLTSTHPLCHSLIR